MDKHFFLRKNIDFTKVKSQMRTYTRNTLRYSYDCLNRKQKHINHQTIKFSIHGKTKETEVNQTRRYTNS